MQNTKTEKTSTRTRLKYGEDFRIIWELKITKMNMQGL